VKGERKNRGSHPPLCCLSDKAATTDHGGGKRRALSAPRAGADER